MNQAPNPANLTKVAESFCLRDKSLQEMTFDCVMAISKVCKLLNQACIYEPMVNENNHKGR